MTLISILQNAEYIHLGNLKSSQEYLSLHEEYEEQAPPRYLQKEKLLNENFRINVKCVKTIFLPKETPAI